MLTWQKYMFLCFCSIGCGLFAFTQTTVVSEQINQSPASTMKAEEKATLILSKLSINDAGKRARVQMVLISHFDSLGNVFAQRKNAMDAAVSQSAGNKELADARSERAWAAAAGKLNKLHATFLGKLSSLLDTEQIEKVKDEMT